MFLASPPSHRPPDDAEAPPPSEPSRPTEPWHRPAPKRETLATLNEEDFDFHDTIPAPPWLDEGDSIEEPFLPLR